MRSTCPRRQQGGGRPLRPGRARLVADRRRRAVPSRARRCSAADGSGSRGRRRRRCRPTPTSRSPSPGSPRRRRRRCGTQTLDVPHPVGRDAAEPDALRRRRARHGRRRRRRAGRARHGLHAVAQRHGQRRSASSRAPATTAPTPARSGRQPGPALATVTFASETATGWQSATLAQPLEVTAGHDVRRLLLRAAGPLLGDVRASSAARWTQGDLTAPGGQQRPLPLRRRRVASRRYTCGAANYFVDVLFERARRVAGGRGDGRRSPVPAQVSGVGQAVAHRVRAARHGLVDEPRPAAVRRSPARRRCRATVAPSPSRPTAPLAADTAYTVTVSGLTSTDGASLPTQTWSFTHGLRRLRHDVAVRRRHPGHGGGRRHVRHRARARGSPRRRTAPSRPCGSTRARATPAPTSGSLWDAGGGAARPGHLLQRDGDRLADRDLRDTGRGDGRHDLRRLLLRTRSAATPPSPGYFATPRTVGPLTAPSGNNGVYRYGAGGGFPTGLVELDQLLRRRRLPRDVAVTAQHSRVIDLWDMRFVHRREADASRTLAPEASATGVEGLVGEMACVSGELERSDHDHPSRW